VIDDKMIRSEEKADKRKRMRGTLVAVLKKTLMKK
jgi:hypothetical protein